MTLCSLRLLTLVGAIAVLGKEARRLLGVGR